MASDTRTGAKTSYEINNHHYNHYRRQRGEVSKYEKSINHNYRIIKSLLSRLAWAYSK